MFTKKKPLVFTKTAANTKPDVENAADAKLPGDKKEDAKDAKTVVKKTKGKGASFFANKAAKALAK